MIPTQPPCCQTLQPSHCMNHPVASSVKAAGSGSPLELPLVESPMDTGNPGYSWFPQMHLVTSSSPSSSIPSSIAFVASPLTSSWLLLVLRACALAETSGSSDDCDRTATEFRCEDDFWSGPALWLARPEVMEDEEELVSWGPEGVVWVVRAREERRGDMTGLWLTRAAEAWYESY